jgi:hypothetical protein
VGEWLSTQKAVSDAEKEFKKAALEVLSLLRALLGYNRSSVYELYWYTSAKKAMSDAEKELQGRSLEVLTLLALLVQ